MIKVLNRPAVLKETEALDAEFRSARWIYHRFLDFEDEHQKVIDAAAETAARGITRTSILITRLEGRKRRAARSTDRQLNYHPVILKSLKEKLLKLKKQRDKSEVWTQAKKWDQEIIDEQYLIDNNIPLEKKKRRQAGESDEAFIKRCAEDKGITRRDANFKKLSRDRRCHWGSLNLMKDSAERAKKSILSLRKDGKSAKIRRPKWNDDQSIRYQIMKNGQSAILNGKACSSIKIERGDLWWTATIPLGLKEDTFTFKFKGGNWHKLPEDAKVLFIQLTRRRLGNGWKYSVSVTIDASFNERPRAESGEIGIDWGHREKGNKIKAFVWTGSDGASGEILLPEEIRTNLDLIMKIKSDLDTAFVARKESEKLSAKNRYVHRNNLLRIIREGGEISDEEKLWLKKEIQSDRRVNSLNQRVSNIRKDLYLKTVQSLRDRYSTFYIEDITGNDFKVLGKEEMKSHRSRQNRDVVARYKFNEICNRYRANLIEVEAKNTTKECPYCGALSEKTSDEIITCLSCGKVRDRDYGASQNILRKGIKLSTDASASVATEQQ